MPQPLVIGLRLVGHKYGRDVLQGIARYARPGKPWVLRYLEREARRPGFRPDGVIGQISDRRVEQAYRALGCPIVNVSAVLAGLAVPSVLPDNRQAGRCAADHFVGQGLRHLAFLSDGRVADYIRLRREGFAEVAQRSGADCAYRSEPALMRVFVGHAPSALRRIPGLLTWLERLPKPVGLLCSSDDLAVMVTELCHSAALHVPGDIAVVAVENNPELCETGWPPVSSVDLNAEQVGFEAARVLDMLLAGRRRVPKTTLIPPAGVTVRGSSDIASHHDGFVARILQAIRDHGAGPLTVRDIVSGIPLSRRPLERRFRRATGHSILGHIQRLRIERAQRFLATTPYTVEHIAGLAGFESYSQMRMVFRRITGVSPAVYRRRCRGGAAAFAEMLPA